jgi:hypothetical protein
MARRQGPHARVKYIYRYQVVSILGSLSPACRVNTTHFLRNLRRGSSGKVKKLGGGG